MLRETRAGLGVRLWGQAHMLLGLWWVLADGWEMEQSHCPPLICKHSPCMAPKQYLWQNTPHPVTLTATHVTPV
jgi:hypothetical protein